MEGYEDTLSSRARSSVDAKRHSPRILLVDDDPVFRAVMVRLAQAEGIDLEAYDSVLEVEPFSRIQSYDGAIFDYHLGQQDGLDLGRCLKPFFSAVPTLLVSGDDSVGEVMKKSAECPFKEFISKRLGCMKIIERMKDLLKSKLQ